MHWRTTHHTLSDVLNAIAQTGTELAAILSARGQGKGGTQ